MAAQKTNLAVDPARIADVIDGLARLTEPGRPYTRRAFTASFPAGRDFLDQKFQAAGLETRVDAAGNLVARRAGRKPGLGTIMLGSHSDTVPDGGRYDGIAGVAVALEVARALADQGVELDHDLEVVDFLAEEVSIFGVSCIGSRGMAGVLPEDGFLRESGGLTLEQGIRDAGGDPKRIAAEARKDIAAFLELHIEQGPVLETDKLDIGVVTAIAGITRIEIIVEGRADPAGTTPMGNRADALAAPSESDFASASMPVTSRAAAHLRQPADFRRSAAARRAGCGLRDGRRQSSPHGLRRRARHGLDGAGDAFGDDLRALPRRAQPCAGRIRRDG